VQIDVQCCFCITRIDKNILFGVVMKRLVLVAALSMGSMSWAAESVQTSSSLSSEEAKVAYSLGFIFGKNNATAIENLDIDKFVAGFKDGYKGQQGLLSEDDIKKH